MPVVSQNMNPDPIDRCSRQLDRILRLEVPVIVRLASRRLTLQEILRLGRGTILEFKRRSEDPLELLVNNRPFGHGQAVKVGENLGLRLTSIGDACRIAS